MDAVDFSFEGRYTSANKGVASCVSSWWKQLRLRYEALIECVLHVLHQLFFSGLAPVSWDSAGDGQKGLGMHRANGSGVGDFVASAFVIGSVAKQPSKLAVESTTEQ